MATQPNRQERVIHQDYIVRQRYSNALPPPPGAPKLLDIPNEGLSRYASPAFASRLARQQPLNIEADAFLGMPIDLVGMPGIFDGDESSIQAPLVAPPVHPRDRKLLRPLKSLGQPKTDTSSVSFLRRTQYVAEENNRVRGDTSSRNKASSTFRRKQTDAAKDDPLNIIRSIVKGFDVANPEDIYRGPDGQEGVRGVVPTPAELEAWKNPKHPTDSKLKLLDNYSILPDLEGYTGSGGYFVTKFGGNPANATQKRDERMDVALLRPIEPTAEQIAVHQQRVREFETDSVHHRDPGEPSFDYEFFLPKDEETGKNAKRKFDVDDPGKDDLTLYTSEGDKSDHESFRFNHIRIYETAYSQKTIHPHHEVAIALYDFDIDRRTRGAAQIDISQRRYHAKKAAYYYPIDLKMQLKPRRDKQLAQLGLPVGSRARIEEDSNKIDAVELVIGDLDPEEEQALESQRLYYDVLLKDGGIPSS